MWPHPPNKVTLSFPRFVSTCKKSAQFIHSSWDTESFRVVSSKRPCPFLTMTKQKSLLWLLAFLNLNQHAKNQFIPLIPHWDNVNFRVLRPGWLHPVFDHTHPYIFQLTFNFYEFVSICKNQAISPFSFKNPMMIGREHFGPYMTDHIFRIYGIYGGISK